MKLILLLFMVLAFASCQREEDTKKTTSKPLPKLEGVERKIVLDSGLGTVYITLPKKMDTFFKWVHYSDNRPSDLKKYRYQSSLYPINLETGWLSKVPDSALQFTISHSDYIDGAQWAESFDEFIKRSKLKEYENDRSIKWIVDKDTTISNHRFWISAKRDQMRGTNLYEVRALALHNKIVVEYNFVYFGKTLYSGDFYKDAFSRLKQIRIED